jgi:RHS repeat-associated protein
MPELPLRRTPRMLAACVALGASTLVTGLATAATLTYRVALDIDSSAATGCTLASANGPVAGIDQVLEITVTTSAANAAVAPVAMRACSGGVLGSPSTIDAGGWAVGIGEGSGGADVIEAARPLALLPPAATIRAIVLADDGAGSDDATAPFTIVLAAAPPPPPPPSIPVPLSPWLAVVLGVGVLAGLEWLRRRHPGRVAPLVVIGIMLVSRVAWAAGVLLDGHVDDWLGVAPAVVDPSGDAPVGVDIVGVHAQHDATKLFLRIDARLIAVAGNAAPVVSAGTHQAVTLPGVATLAGSARDDGMPDPPGAVTLTWSVASGPGAGVLFADAHAAQTTATFVAPGTYVLTLVADDGARTSHAEVTITVADGGPVIQAIADRTITLGDRLLQQLTAQDANVTATLTFSLSQSPAGATLAAPALVDWTPAPNQVGTHAFTARVADGQGRSAFTTFNVTVVRNNHAPSLAAQADAAIGRGQPFARTLEASDPDGDTLAFELVGGPPGMTLTGSALAWDTTGVTGARYTVTVRARDPGGLFDTRSFAVTFASAVAPLARDDEYVVSAGATLTVPAPGVLANDASALGAALAATRLGDPDKGTLSAFDADGSFTFVAPAALPPATSLALTPLAGGFVNDSTGYAWSADVNHDGGADMVTTSFGTPMATDGKTGARLWTGWDTSQTSPGRSCLMYLFGTDFALGDVDDSGDVALIAGTNCDPTYSAGVATRLIAVDTNPAHAVAGAARVKWMSQRLDEKLLASPPGGGTPVPTYVLDTQGSGLANSAVPTLARLTPGGAVKVLTRTLIGPNMFFFDRDGDGSRETDAGCAAATGNEADLGKTCTVTFIVDAATGVKEAALTAPNPRNWYSTTNWYPFRQLPVVVADLDGDGQVEIVSGDDVFELVGGWWTLARQLAPLPGAINWFEPNSIAVADLDGDGKAEIIRQSDWDVDYDGRKRGFQIYASDGRMLRSFEVPAWDIGMTTVADVDADGAPEIVFSARGVVYAYRPDGTMLWASVFPDDDGTLPGDPPGRQYWPQAVGERTRSGNAVQVYDLALDGSPEVVANGNFRIAIIDGRTGVVKSSVHHNGYYANNGVPQIVDADGDGHAEIFSAASSPGICGGCASVNTIPFAGENRDWAPAPLVFNQANYNPWAVDDAGAIRYDGGVHRSFRNQRQLGTVVDRRTRESATFTYAASDAGGTSAPASVRVQIVPPNRPPVITSTPPSAIDVVLDAQGHYPSFVYQVAAIDPDVGDTVHYELVYSTINTYYFPQVTVDAMTGAMHMYTGPCGSYGGPCDMGTLLVVVAAIDSFGARSEQAFNVDVTYVKQTVPDVVGQRVDDARAAVAAATLTPKVTEAFDTHPAGTVIAQDPAGGTALVRSGTVMLTVSKGSQPVTMPYVVGKTIAAARQQLGALGLAVDTTTQASTSIPAGQVVAQVPAFGATIVPSPSSPALLTVSSGPPLGGAIAKIVVVPATTTRLVGDDVGYRAFAVLADGTARDVTLAATWTATPPEPVSLAGSTAHAAHAGSTTITAALEGASGSAMLTIASPVAEGSEPDAIIASPQDGGSVVGPVDVIGTANDDHFLRYELAYAADGDEDFTPLAHGSAPVVAGVLGRFDPTVLQNGIYTIQLSVHDRGGNVSVARVSVTVEGNRKVGAFTLAYDDLTVPLAGIPIEIVRMYDSRNKARGDFGIGWTLGLKAVRVATTRAPGDGWEVYKSGLNYELDARSARYITVTLPSGRVETFDLRITPSSSPLVPFETLRASVVARPGTQGTLEILSNTDLLIVDPQPGPVTLVDDATLESFAPDRFRYRQRDGTEFIVTRSHGVESAKDANGNAITVTPGGISHSTGVAVTFARDADDRITAITDPAGNTRTYAYSGEGDLAAATDRTGNTTRYFYDRAHGVVRIEDPLGRAATRTGYDDAGHVISVTDANGNTTQYRHDLDGRQEQVEDALGRVTIYTYDDRGNVTAKTDPLGRTTTAEYDARDRMTRVTNALGATSRVEFDDHDNPTRITDALGRTRTMAYDDAGMLVTDTDSRGRATHYAYDDAHRLVSVTDALGRVRSIVNGAAGNPTAITEASGATTAIAYDPAGRAASITDALGNVVALSRDANGRLASQTLPGGGAAALAYDAEGRVLSSTQSGRTRTTSYDATGALATLEGANGIAVSIGTDAGGRLTGISEPSGGTLVAMVYDAAGNVVGINGASGEAAERRYDAANQLIETRSPSGAVERRAYDAAGRLVQVVDARGFSRYFTFDAGNRLTSATDTLGGVTRHEYDDGGNETATIDPLGRITRFTYDAADRLTQVTYPDGTSERTRYDDAGHIASRVDAGGGETRYEYDALGRLLRTTDPRGGTIVHAYEGALGFPTRTTDANGHVTQRAYDGSGRLVSTTGPDGGVETETYDALGRRTARRNAAGETTTWTYDARGRMTKVTTADGAATTIGYSAEGLRTSVTDASGTTRFTYDGHQRPLAVTAPDGSFVRFGYDAAGLRTSVTHGDSRGERTLAYAFDAAGRIVQMTDSDGGISRQAFDAAGNLTTVAHANGIVTTMTYDARDRVRSITERAPGGAVLAQRTYTRNAYGDVTRIDAFDGARVDYAYDALRRVVAETAYAPGGTIASRASFTWDAAGNRTTAGSVSAPAAYSYDVADRLASGGGFDYDYDAAGRRVAARWIEQGTPRTARYRWNSLGRLTGFDDGFGATWSYGYDADGLRQRKTGDAGTTAFVLDRDHGSGFAQVLRASGPLSSDVFDWMNGLAGVREGTQGYVPLADALQSIRAMTDAGAALTDVFAYDAFGRGTARSGAASALHRFAGEAFDAESGLVYLRARYYDPRTATFLSGDPRPAVLDDTQSANRYQYALGNPVNRRDPGGLETLVELNVTQSIDATVGKARSALNARRALAQTKDVAVDIARLEGGLMAIESVVEAMTTSPARVERWFGIHGGAHLALELYAAEVGEAVNATVSTLASAGMAVTAFNMLGGKDVDIHIEGLGVLLARSLDDAKSSLVADANAGANLCKDESALAWATRGTNIITICTRMFGMPPMPNYSTLTMPGRSSWAGVLLHEYSHISIGTVDNRYNCHPDGARRLLDAAGIGNIGALRNADSYRCWGEDTRVGFPPDSAI